MLRRTAPVLMYCTTVLLEGWESSSSGGWGGVEKGSGGGSGGWGSGDRSSNSGGWGSGSGGWGGADKSSGGGSGGWGSGDRSSGGSGGWGSGSGGWGGADKSSGGGSGGWGSGDRSSNSGGWGGGKDAWSGGEGGWGSAATGSRQQNARGNFRRGRQQSQTGWGGGGVWGQPPAADEEAWNAAPPSFQPPVRRVDPLTLTAVEVEIDGLRKLVGQRVQVSGVSDETTWHTLKDHLRQTGDVTFCRIFSGGRAMVEFATPEDAARAITELQGSELEGATLFLREDREDTVLINTRRKIREARETQLRSRKAEVEQRRKELAKSQGDVEEPTSVSETAASVAPKN